METGAEINPVTQRPKSLRSKEKAQVKEAFTRKKLEQQVSDLNLVLSEDADKFKDLVVGAAQRRLEVLIQEDPEAHAYHQILRDLGHRVNIAKQAAKKLYDMNVQPE